MTTMTANVSGNRGRSVRRVTISYRYEPGFFGRLFGREPREWAEVYEGFATAWHKLPDFEACDFGTRRWLRGIVERDECRQRTG